MNDGIPGAGVDPNKVIRPSNRVKRAWRESATGSQSLKAFARQEAENNTFVDSNVATAWLDSKGPMVHLDAKVLKVERQREKAANARR